jgi:hypothetical protein
MPMVKLLLIIGLFSIALAAISLVAKRAGSQQKLDHSIERIAWFGGVALLVVIVLLACEKATGRDYISTMVERFVRWLNS